MKTRVLCATLFLVAAAGLFAQSRYDVPFAFQAGDTSFEAGRYTIAIGPDDGMLWIISQDRRATLVRPQVGMVAPELSSSNKLVFRCYGRACFLTQVWRAGDGMVTQLGKSRAEREMASRKAQPALVYASVR